MNSEQIDAATKLGRFLGGLPRRATQKPDVADKRIRNMLYPIRNAQNSTSLIKAIADAQRGVDKLSEQTLFFPVRQKKDASEQQGPTKAYLWVDAELVNYLAGAECEWGKVKQLIVVAASNLLSSYNRDIEQK